MAVSTLKSHKQHRGTGVLPVSARKIAKIELPTAAEQPNAHMLNRAARDLERFGVINAGEQLVVVDHSDCVIILIVTQHVSPLYPISNLKNQQANNCCIWHIAFDPVSSDVVPEMRHLVESLDALKCSQ